MIELVGYSGFCCPKGPEKENQDYILPIKKVGNSYIMAVADGVGGYAGGGIASQAAIDFVSDEKNSNSMLYGREYFEKLRTIVSEKTCHDIVLKNAATTLTLCIVSQDCIRLLHIGDCRAYLKNGQKLSQITLDHTNHQRLLDEKIYNKKELKMKKGRNVLYTAISKNIDLIFQEETIFINDVADKDGSLEIFIMSDGAHSFWEKRPRFSENTMNSPSQFSASLFKRIIKAGPIDDYSLVAAKFKVTNEV